MNGSGDNSQESAASMLANELFELCKSGSLSTEGLRELIERHGLTPNNHNHVSDYKFFHLACINERATEEIIRCLLEYFPDAASTIDNGLSPLHLACYNHHVTGNIIRLLIDAAPASVRSVANAGEMPLHILCANKTVNEGTAIQILKLLIEKYPEAIRRENNNGRLPVHSAAGRRSPEFCRVLIEAYPGSERITTTNGLMPLHLACIKNSLATVEYLYRQYTDAINHAATGGLYPIHTAILGTRKRDNPAAAVETVQYLLSCDPNVKLQTLQGKSLLYFACGMKCNDSNIEAGIQLIKIIFDAHPQAIEDNSIASNIHRFHQQVQEFINGELVYARQAKDHRLITTPDENGQLPLHRALQNNVRLGSIKLLVKGNPHALQYPDGNGALPLLIACQHHDSANVVRYFVGLDVTTLRAVDREGNTALHHACRGAKYDTIALLLENYDAVSVSKRNSQKKLPIDLLWESNQIFDRESVEYMDSVFRLLKAYPETLRNDGTEVESAFDVCPSQSGNGRKRKFGND